MLSSVVVSAPRLRSKLEHIKKVIDQGWVEDVRGLGHRAVNYLKENTPRSDGPGSQRGEHIADGWELEVIGGNAKSARGILMVVYNRFMTTKAGRILARARLRVKDEPQDYTLMHVLEYGSKPHPIYPFKKKVLRFISDTGKAVFTKSVHHPGTKPVGMIRACRSLLPKWHGDFESKWKRKLNL